MALNVSAIAFDVFETLVEIKRPQRALLPLMEWLRNNDTTPRRDEYEWLMTRDFNLASLAPGLTQHAVQDIEERLSAEIASITPYPDAVPTLSALQKRGYKIALCSNVITPYVGPTLGALQTTFDAALWSCIAQAAKPDPAIYLALARDLNLPPNQILFVGDNIEHDVIAPAKAGMSALYLRRDYTPSAQDREISSLAELVHRLPGPQSAPA